MLTVKQAAARLRISPSLVYSWCEDHLLPHYRMGANVRRGKILIALDAFLQSRKVEGKPVDASFLGLKHITLRQRYLPFSSHLHRQPTEGEPAGSLMALGRGNGRGPFCWPPKAFYSS